jgi:hypothetical protein
MKPVMEGDMSQGSGSYLVTRVDVARGIQFSWYLTKALCLTKSFSGLWV